MINIPQRIVLILSSLLVLFGVETTLSAATQTTFFVSPGGNDSRDGRSAATAFASLAQARDAIRPLTANMTGDIVIDILKGDYPVEKTIAFTDRDSGSNGFHVVYKSHDGVGAARLMGGIKVTGWTKYRGDIYRANIAPGLAFTTMYENGIRADLARWPKRTSPFATSRAGYMTFIDKKGENLTLLDSALSPDGKPFDGMGEDLSNAWVYAWNGGDGHRWSSVTSAITSASSLNIGIKSCGLGYPPDSFLVEGSFQLLTRPGEFFYEKSTGELYYMSRFPGSIARQEVIVPHLIRLLSIAGPSPAAPVHDIRFEGLVLSDTDRIAQSHTDDWEDANPASWEAALYVKNANNIAIQNCKVADTGINGITFDTANQACTVTGCLIEHTGYHGINIRDGSGDLVSNCLIRYVAELAGHGCGVSVVKGSHTLSHLEIYYSPRAAIALRSKGDQVEYTKVHDCVQDSGDQGAFYLVDPASNATINQCTSFHNYVDLSCMDRPPTAVYNDRDATDTIWSNIDAGDSQFYTFRHDPQKKGTLTFKNVSWDPKCNPRANEVAKPVNPDFDKSKMEYDKIGLTSEFPGQFNDLSAKPDGPLNLWSQPGFNAVTLHWTQADHAIGYTIERSATPGGPYRQVGTTHVPATGWDVGTTFEDMNLTNGTPYYYVVKAMNSFGQSPDSVEIVSTPSKLGQRKLTGRTIGTGGALAAAFDGDLKTFFDSPNGWVGLDLGDPAVITEIRYAPRSDNTNTTAKMCGGRFEGSNDPDFAVPVTLFEVRATKGGAVTPVLIPAAIFNPTPFRYVRFLGPTGKEALIAEMQFFGHPAP